MEMQHPIKPGFRFSVICIAVLMAAKFAGYLLAENSMHLNEDVIFSFFMIWLLFYFLGNTLIHYRLSSKYNRYLYENHRAKYDELTSIVGIRPSDGLTHNSFREIPFLFSDDDLGDPNILPMKAVVRKSLIFFLFVFFSIPVLIIVFLFI